MLHQQHWMCPSSNTDKSRLISFSNQSTLNQQGYISITNHCIKTAGSPLPKLSWRQQLPRAPFNILSTPGIAGLNILHKPLSKNSWPTYAHAPLTVSSKGAHIKNSNIRCIYHLQSPSSRSVHSSNTQLSNAQWASAKSSSSTAEKTFLR